MRLVQISVRSIREMVFDPVGGSLLLTASDSMSGYALSLYRYVLTHTSAPLKLGLEVPANRASAIHPTGRLAVRLSSDDSDEFVGVYNWDPHHKPQMLSSSIRVRSIYGLAFGATGDRIAVSCDFSDYDDSDFGVFVWETASGRELIRFRTPVNPGDVLLSPDGRTLIVASDQGGAIWTYDLPTGYFQAINNVDARSIAISPSGKCLAAAGRRIVIWDLEGMYRECFFRGQDEDVPSLAFSPDLRILAVARTDGPVEFWDVQTGQLVRRYEWNIGRLGAIAFAPDGLTCAVAGDQGRIVIWDVDD